MSQDKEQEVNVAVIDKMSELQCYHVHPCVVVVRTENVGQGQRKVRN